MAKIFGEKLYTPPPPFWPEGIFKGEGRGYILKPPRGRILVRRFKSPPPLEGYFQGWGDGDV